MIVFIDSDHVLHSLTDGCDQQSLDAALLEYPDVSIVITSSQRAEQSLDELPAPFSRDIAARVVGVTPACAIEGVVDLPGSYYRKILLYLDEHPTSHWVAPDAEETSFPSACEDLRLCDNGLDMFASMDLQSKLHCALPPAANDHARRRYVRIAHR
jgi:hypothetical protein